MQKILFILPSFWLGWTEKTAQIYLKYLKNEFDVYACALNKTWPREWFFKENAKDVFVCHSDFSLLQNFIKKEKIDILYLHGISWKNNSLELISFLRWAKWKNINIIETSPFSLFTPDTEKYVDQKLFVSKTSLLKFLWKFKQPDITKYNYLYNPIDCKYLENFRLKTSEKDELRKQYNLDDKFVIGKVGRADIWKRDDTIIDIVPNLIKKIPNLMIIVRSMPKSKLKKIKRKKIEKHFLILPESSDEREIAETYQLMDIMLHTSRIWESFWITLVEWMFFGLPIISNSTDWMQRTIYDRDNSQSEIIWQNNYITNSKKKMIEKIVELKEDKKMYNQISNDNVKRVYETFYANILRERLKNFLLNNNEEKKILIFDKEINNYKKLVISENLFIRMYLSVKAIYEKFLLK